MLFKLQLPWDTDMTCTSQYKINSFFPPPLLTAYLWCKTTSWGNLHATLSLIAQTGKAPFNWNDSYVRWRWVLAATEWARRRQSGKEPRIQAHTVTDLCWMFCLFIPLFFLPFVVGLCGCNVWDRQYRLSKILRHDLGETAADGRDVLTNPDTWGLQQ